MRNPSNILAPALAVALLSACGPSNQNSVNSNASNARATVSVPVNSPGSEANPGAPQSDLPVATGHSSTSPQTTVPAGPGPGGAVDTSAYDVKIKQAETKAKAAGASDSDKKAAAAAYLERGNFYYTAGQPSLYKLALGDFRTVLKYDPNNEDARAKTEQIISIYQSMGRPVPSNGLDQ